MHGGGPAVVPGSPASSPGFDSNPLYLTGIKPGYVRLKKGTICFLRPKNETTISYTVTKQLTSGALFYNLDRKCRPFPDKG